MSGTGSNVNKILERVYVRFKSKFKFFIFTDALESRAYEISLKYRDVGFLYLDMKNFYSERGYSSTSLLQTNGFVIREQYTAYMWDMLRVYDPVLGIFAGFEVLCNICNHFRCINIHPGDLTQEKDNKRILVGLGTAPIKQAIRYGYKTMCSTVIEVDPIYELDDMDSGKILDISPEVPITTNGHTCEELVNNQEILESLAKTNLRHLKEQGDWYVFPRCVEGELKKLL